MVKQMSETPSRHRLDVQGLRAVAVLLVMLYHAELPVSGGFTGVDVFFVISGFVITGLLRRELQATGSIHIRAFFARRVQRILPALAVLLGATMVGAVLLQPPLGPQQDTAGTAFAAASFWANFYLYQHTEGYFDDPSEANPLLHTWSLSAEEQFYIFFPLFLLVFSKLIPKMAGVALMALAVASFGGHLAGVQGTLFDGVNASWSFFSAPARAWQFAAGALLAYAPIPTATTRWLPSILGLAAAGLLLNAALGYHQDTLLPGWEGWVPVIGAVLAIFAGSVGKNPFSTLLSTPALVWIGDRSYSLYLWHWPMVVFARLLFPSVTWAPLAATALAVLPAALSFTFVEAPLRRATLAGGQVVGLGLLCTAGPMLLALGMEAGAARAWGDEVMLAAEAVRTAPKGIGCEWDAHKGGQPQVCIREHPGATKTLLLVGDSHATAISSMFASMAAELGYNAAVSSALGCPFARIPLVDPDGPRDHCNAFIDHTRTWIQANNPALVVVANRSPVNVNPTVWLYDEKLRKRLTKCAGTKFGPKGKNCLSMEEALPLWDEGLRAVITPIAMKTPVLLLGTVPEHQHNVMDCVERARVDTACAQTPRAVVDERRSAVLNIERALAAASPRVDLYDPIDLFCDAQTCAQWADGAFWYRDDDHLAADGAARLKGPLAEAIRATLSASP